MSPKVLLSPKDSAGFPSLLRAWLCCAAFYYPFFWLSIFTVQATPALVRVPLFGFHLEYFEISTEGAFARSVPWGALDFHHAHPLSHGGPLLGTLIILVLLIGLIAAAIGRNHHLLSGLFIAVLGQAAFVHTLPPRWPFRIHSPFRFLGAILFFVVMCLGLYWMLSALNLRGYVKRVVGLLAIFAVLPELMFIILSFRMEIWPYSLALIVSGIVAAFVASLVGGRLETRFPVLPGWKTFAAGVGISFLIFGSSQEARLAAERAKASAQQAILASLPKVSPDLPYPKLFFQKGVNFTAEFPASYDSEEARRMLQQLPASGVNAIALVPYGWLSMHPLRLRIEGQTGWENDVGIEELARVAHARGMKVFLKPAIWRAGEMQFSSAEDRKEWFAQYRLFLEHYAKLATQIHADLFSVGGEFVHLTQYESEWRGLIARVRKLYPGPLVYAANFGDEFEQIQFWDALDYIGLQEYYPLPDNLSMKDVLAKVEAVQQKFHRPVIFTEAGFPSLEGANRAPWDDSRKVPISLNTQEECYQAVFQAFYRKPWFEGMYWWKVGTNGYGGPLDGSHTPWDKPAMKILQQWYLDGGR